MTEKNDWYSIKLAVVIIAVFFLSNVFPDFFFSNFALVSDQALSRPWTFVTHIFLHSGFLHLAYNMIALFIFGTILEETGGSRKFLMVFFVSGILAGFATPLFYNASVGASGGAGRFFCEQCRIAHFVAS